VDRADRRLASAQIAGHRSRSAALAELPLDRAGEQAKDEQHVFDAHVRRVAGNSSARERSHALDDLDLMWIVAREVCSAVERPLESVSERSKQGRPVGGFQGLFKSRQSAPRGQ
jgi:hypothetical protein